MAEYGLNTRSDLVNDLKREYGYSEGRYLTTFNDTSTPQIVNSDFLNCMRHSHLVITAKQAWGEHTIKEIYKTQLRFALVGNGVDAETLDKMVYSLYHYMPTNTLSWYSLMSFFFHLGNGYIVQSKVGNPGQMIGALKIFINEAKRREDECQRAILAEEKEILKNNDNAITWEQLCAKRNYPDEWYDIRNFHAYLMAQEGKEIKLTLINSNRRR